MNNVALENSSLAVVKEQFVDLDHQLNSLKESIVENQYMAESVIEQAKFYAAQVRESMEKLGMTKVAGYEIIKYTTKNVSYSSDTITSSWKRRLETRRTKTPKVSTFLTKITPGAQRDTFSVIEAYPCNVEAHRLVDYKKWSFESNLDEDRIEFLNKLPYILAMLQKAAERQSQNLAKGKTILQGI